MNIEIGSVIALEQHLPFWNHITFIKVEEVLSQTKDEIKFVARGLCDKDGNLEDNTQSRPVLIVKDKDNSYWYDGLTRNNTLFSKVK
jgi:hypothetical protein